MSPKTTFSILGNPNCGKTAIFNLLTGLNQKVSNYPGITVEKKVAKVDISKELSFKIKAIKAYKNELREFPHPRSIIAIESNARKWGSVSGFNFAEAFSLVRSLDG